MFTSPFLSHLYSCFLIGSSAFFPVHVAKLRRTILLERGSNLTTENQYSSVVLVWQVLEISCSSWLKRSSRTGLLPVFLTDKWMVGDHIQAFHAQLNFSCFSRTQKQNAAKILNNRSMTIAVKLVSINEADKVNNLVLVYKHIAVRFSFYDQNLILSGSCTNYS